MFAPFASERQTAQTERRERHVADGTSGTSRRKRVPERQTTKCRDGMRSYNLNDSAGRNLKEQILKERNLEKGQCHQTDRPTGI